MSLETKIILRVLAVLLLLGLAQAVNHPKDPKMPLEGNSEALVMLQNNTLVGISNPNIPTKKEIIKTRYPELFRIITCESNWRNVCNQKYGCGAGMGLAQIIPSTWKFTQENGIKVASPFNEDDNLTAAIWLYENYGNKPWKQSAKCWQN